MPSASREIEVDVAPAAFMGVICDFGAYPRFLPDMVEATVLRAGGGRWTVKYGLRIIRRLDYTLEHERHGDHELTWELVEGAFKSNRGAWTLEPLDGGARTRARYTLEIDFGTFVPGSVVKTLLERNLPATLEAFKRRAELAA